MSSRYKEFYKNSVIPNLIKETGYKNINQIPKLVKIVINMGLGEATSNSKIIEQSLNELTKIAGQKPVVSKAKKIYCGVQIKRKSGNRLFRYAKKRQDV